MNKKFNYYPPPPAFSFCLSLSETRNKIIQKMCMSHFAYACKMRYPLNLVLENCKYLWFF